jgi:hypothetical protein
MRMREKVHEIPAAGVGVGAGDEMQGSSEDAVVADRWV